MLVHIDTIRKPEVTAKIEAEIKTFVGLAGKGHLEPAFKSLLVGLEDCLKVINPTPDTSPLHIRYWWEEFVAIDSSFLWMNGCIEALALRHSSFQWPKSQPKSVRLYGQVLNEIHRAIVALRNFELHKDFKLWQERYETAIAWESLKVARSIVSELRRSEPSEKRHAAWLRNEGQCARHLRALLMAEAEGCETEATKTEAAIRSAHRGAEEGKSTRPPAMRQLEDLWALMPKDRGGCIAHFRLDSLGLPEWKHLLPVQAEFAKFLANNRGDLRNEVQALFGSDGISSEDWEKAGLLFFRHREAKDTE